MSARVNRLIALVLAGDALITSVENVHEDYPNVEFWDYGEHQAWEQAWCFSDYGDTDYIRDEEGRIIQ